LQIGRRLLPHEYPPDSDTVLDLTSEFNVLRSVPERYQYISFPMLDGLGADVSRLVPLLQRLDSIPGKLYIHCAQGHGRTGFVTAAWMLYKGWAQSPDDALQQILAARPAVKLSAIQRARLDDFARDWPAMTGTPGT